MGNGRVGARDRSYAPRGWVCEHRTHEQASGREEPHPEPVRIDLRMLPQREGRIAYVLVRCAEGLLVDESVLEHPAGKARPRQQGAIGPVGRPVRWPHLAIPRNWTSVHHQHSRGGR